MPRRPCRIGEAGSQKPLREQLAPNHAAAVERVSAAGSSPDPDRAGVHLFYEFVAAGSWAVPHARTNKGRWRRPDQLTKALAGVLRRRRDNVLISVIPRRSTDGGPAVGPVMVFEWDPPREPEGHYDLGPTFVLALALYLLLDRAGVAALLVFTGHKSWRVLAASADLGLDPMEPAEPGRVRAIVLRLATLAGALPDLDTSIYRRGQLWRVPGCWWRPFGGGPRQGAGVYFDADEDLEDVVRRSLDGPGDAYLPHAEWIRRPIRSPPPFGLEAKSVVAPAERRPRPHGTWPPLHQVLAALAVPISRTGRFRCPWPDHPDRHPSCSVFEETNTWRCWSHTAATGQDQNIWSAITLVRLVRGCTFNDACAWLQTLRTP